MITSDRWAIHKGPHGWDITRPGDTLPATSRPTHESAIRWVSRDIDRTFTDQSERWSRLAEEMWVPDWMHPFRMFE